MPQLYANNCATTLAAPCSDVATEITLTNGANFPSPSGGDWFLLTLYQLSGAQEINFEIVKVTARASNVITVVRAFEDATRFPARSYTAGDFAELRMTAGSKGLASQIVNVPAGNIAATDVQAAIAELDTEKQPVDATLTALAGVTVAADKLIYATGADAFATADLTSFGRSLIDDADATTARATLGVVIGTDVQAYDAELAALAGLTSASDKLPYFSGSGTAALADFTAAGRALVDDADASAQRTTLGLGTVATLASDTDGTLAANSDTKVATQKAVKTYVDTAVTGLLDFKGSTDTSSNPDYPAASKGDSYVVSVAGKIGGASGISVDVGDVYAASADNAGGTQASVGTSWFVLEHNLVGALLSANNLSDLASASTARTNLGLGTLATQSGTFSGTSSGTNTGDETTTTIGALINGATEKTTPVDADFFGLMDSAASNILKKFSWANLKATLIGTVLTWTKAQRGAYVALTDAATIALDLSMSNNYSVVIGGNRTLGAPTNAVAGQTGQIAIRQDATGTRTLAYAWPYVWADGTAGVLTTAGCSLDQLVYDVETYTSSTVTITIATPGVVSWTAHELKNGQRIQLTTTGALPTGLTASTTYFVTNSSADAFSLSTTLINAAAGTKIATSGSQSGVHTMTAATIKVALNKAYA